MSHEPLPSVRQFAPDLPEALEEVIYKALAKRIDLRYQTAGDLRSALQEAHLALPPSVRAAQITPSTSPESPVLTPVFDVETRILPEENRQPENTSGVNVSTDRGSRSRALMLALGFIGALLVAGFLVLRGDSALESTNTQPAVMATELSPTPTSSRTPSPTDEPPTTTSTPTQTATQRPTRVWPTRTLEPTDTHVPPTPSPSPTPAPPTNTRVPPTNPPPPTSVPPDGGQQPPPQDGGQQPPPPENNDSNVVQDTVEDVGDTIDNVTDGLGLP